MPFFQNLFTSDFYGVWLLADRHASLDFFCNRNFGRGDEMVVAYKNGPYDLSGNDADGNPKSTFTLSFAINDFTNWSDISTTITADDLSSVTAEEFIGSLNNDSAFSDWFKITLDSKKNSPSKITIRQKKPATTMKFYVKNGQAESVLNFNKLAGVSELPSYFDRHTIENRFKYKNGQNALIKLSNTGVDAEIINNALNYDGTSLGYSSSTIQTDYQLLKGRSGLFMFKKNVIDESNRITQTLEYQAGANIGDMAKKINYTYTDSNTQPDTITEIPYVLQSGDILTP